MTETNWLDIKLPIKHQPTHLILDASKLNTYMTCPRKFFYEYLLGWRSETPNNHLVFGQAWHHALEHITLNGYGEDSLYDAFKLFEQHYRLVFTPDTDEIFWPKTPDRVFQALAAYAQKWESTDNEYEVLHTEIAGSVICGFNELEVPRILHFRMDTILRDQLGRFFSHEHKTGSWPTGWASQWEMAIQPSLYNHVLMSHYGFENVYGVVMNGVFFLKNKGTRGGQLFDFQRVPIIKTKSQMQIWFEHLNQWLTFVENDYIRLNESTENDKVLTAFIPNSTSCFNYGKRCIFGDFCVAWSNPLQRCSEPPIGFIEEHWNPMAQEAKHTIKI